MIHMTDTNDINEQIYTVETELNAMKDRKYELKEITNEIERNIEEEVILEAEGGDKSLSNAQKRKVEINIRLDNHPEYKDRMYELKRLERDINNKSSQTGMLKRQFWDIISQRFSQVM